MSALPKGWKWQDDAAYSLGRWIDGSSSCSVEYVIDSDGDEIVINADHRSDHTTFSSTNVAPVSVISAVMHRAGHEIHSERTQHLCMLAEALLAAHRQGNLEGLANDLCIAALATMEGGQ